MIRYYCDMCTKEVKNQSELHFWGRMPDGITNICPTCVQRCKDIRDQQDQVTALLLENLVERVRKENSK
jgi:hypothetical protein